MDEEMKRKTIAVNGKGIVVSHEIKVDRNQTVIKMTAHHGGVTLAHNMTIGAEDEPLPMDYTAEKLQADVNKAREKLATLVESKHRASQMAALVI
jgi:hypothetical protein